MNSTFRTTEQQSSNEIQIEGTTVAFDDGSKHVAGLGFDFNLFVNNDRLQGILKGNEGTTADNVLVRNESYCYAIIIVDHEVMQEYEKLKNK